VVKKNVVAAKLTGDDPPTAAKNLKLLLTLNADAKFEALHPPKRIINVSNWVIATNDNDGPAQRLGCWCPGRSFESPLLMPKQFFKIDSPKPVIVDDLGVPVVAGKPSTARSAVRKCKGDGIGIVLVSNDLRSNKSP
jgi:hypothetical protein